MPVTIQTRDADGTVVIFANPDNPPAGRDGFTIRELDSVPAGPGKLRWDSPTGALVRAVAPPTPQQTFAAAVAAGYTVPGVTPPLVLDMSDPARNLFHQLSYQLGLMKAAGRIADSDQITITDKAGAPRSFSVANVQTMILGLGETYLGLFAALHAGA